MPLTIELAPEVETALARRAASLGLTLRDYIEQVLDDHVRMVSTPPALTPEERAAIWRQAPRFSTRILLSDEAIDRASIYGERG